MLGQSAAENRERFRSHHQQQQPSSVQPVLKIRLDDARGHCAEESVDKQYPQGEAEPESAHNHPIRTPKMVNSLPRTPLAATMVRKVGPL
jgi:hypothetical protein